MDIRYAGKHLKITNGIKKHLEEKLVKFERYAPRLIESHAFFKKEKYIYTAEITLLAKSLKAYGEGTSKENIYAAIDMAYVRVEKQLKKFREKIKDHSKGRSNKRLRLKDQDTGKIFETSGLESDKPKIVRSRSFAMKPMSIEEASLQLEISREPFLVFRNASTQQVNVVFKRKDGNHGLVEPDLF